MSEDQGSLPPIALPAGICTRFSGCACWDHDDAFRLRCRHWMTEPLERIIQEEDGAP